MTTVESAFVLIDRASGTIRDIRRELRGLESDAKSAGRSLDDLSGPRVARQMDAQAREMRVLGNETQTTGRKLDETDRSMGRVETRLTSLRNKTKDAHLQFGVLGKVIGALKWPALIAGAGGAAQVLGSLVAGAVALLPKLLDLGGVAAGFGTTMLGAGAAIGVAKLATQGLSQALNGNKRALQGLTPEGRAFVQVLKSLHPEIQKLRSTAQQGLFPGLGSLLSSVKSQAPQIRGIVGQTARDLGGLGTFLGQQLSSPGFMRDLRSLADQGSRSFGSAARGGFYFAQALEQVLLAAAPLTDWLGTAFVHMGKLAEQEAFIGRETGSLGMYFDRTKTALQTMWDTAKHVFGGLSGVMQAARGDSNSLWGSIDKTATRFDQWTNSVAGQTRMRRWFDDMRPVLSDTLDIIGGIAKWFASLTGGGQATKMLDAFKQAGPAIGNAIKSITENFGPVLAQTMGSVAKFLADMSGTAGPLTLVARALGLMAGAADRLLKFLGPVGQAMAQAFGTYALAKKLNLFDSLDALRLKWRGVGDAAAGAAAQERIAASVGGAPGVGPVMPATRGVPASGPVVIPGVPGSYNTTTTASGLTVAEEAAMAGGGSAAAVAYLRSKGALSASEAFGAQYGNAGADLTGSNVVRGARFGGPVLGDLSAAGGAVGDAGLLARLGGFGSKALAGVGKIALPLTVISGLLGALGTQGGVGNRALGGLNAATFGLGGKALNALSFGVIPGAPGPTKSQRQTAGGQYAANLIQGLNNSSSLGAQRRTISGLRTVVQTLPGNDAFDNNTKDIKSATNLLKAELKRRISILHDSQLAADQALDAQSIRHAQALSTDFANAFTILAKGKGGPQAAMKETVGHVLDEMRQMRPAGAKVLDESMIAWAEEQARQNPKLKGQVKNLIDGIKNNFSDLHKHVQVVNGQILTGSQTEWKAIQAAMENPVEQAREQISSNLTAIQQEAIGSLTAMGYTRSQAATLVGNIAAKQQGAKNINVTGTGAQHGGHFARGGRIYRLPGSGTLDTVPMMDGGFGAPGELVVNQWTERDINHDLMTAGKPSLEQRVRGETRKHSDQRSLGGRLSSTLGQIGAALQTAPGSVAGQHPELHAGIAAAVQSVLNKFPLTITSTTGGGHVANSYHYRGEAADISGDTGTMYRASEWIKGNIAGQLTEGIHNPNLAVKYGQIETPPGVFGGVWAGHANHIHMAVAGAFKAGLAAAAGGGGGALGGQLKALKAPASSLGGVPGLLVNRAGAAYAAGLTQKINQKIGASGGMNFAGVAGLGGSAGQNEALGRRMMLAAGWPAAEWPALQALWTQESGWSSTAVNPSSGAYGIPQALGHGHPYNLGDARAQIAWGLNYIKGRYGSPSSAEAHEKSFNWYAGGTDQVVTRPTVFGAGEAGPERVKITRPGHGSAPITIQRGAVQINSAGGDPRAILKLVDRRLRQFAEEVAAEIEAGAEEPASGVIG